MQDLFFDELKSIEREFPGFSIRQKRESRLCRFLGAVLWVLTFGQSRFTEAASTLIGKTLYVPLSWNEYRWIDRWITLRHELIHLRQAKRMGFGRFWLGWPIWAFSYLFLLPLGLTIRSRLEREAYEETIHCSRRFGVAVSRTRLFALFVGPEYFWMDLRSRKVSAWLDAQGL